MVDVFDEEIVLRRFEIALKRADWRMFGDAVARLGEQLAGGSPFARLADWRELVRRSGEHEALPAALADALREVVARMLDVDARVLGLPAQAAPGGPAVVVVDLWRSPLLDPVLRDAFRLWLARPGAASAAAGRRRLAAWLDDGLSLAAIATRAQLALAADAAGLAAGEPAWADVFFAGLRAVTAGVLPGPAGLTEALDGQGPVVVLTGDPVTGPAAGIEVLTLGGALDWAYCQACREAAPAAGAIVAACPTCGGPAWPLVAPTETSDWLPPPLRRTWEQAADALRAAATWVVIAPPAPDDPLARWVLERLPADRRVFVIGGEEHQRAWRVRLEAAGVAALVTSKGPAADVLAYLLTGGVPAGEPAEAVARSGFGKKKRR